MGKAKLRKPDKIRCSSLDRFFACASSAVSSLAPHNPDSDAADLGTLVHDIISATIRGRPAPVAPKNLTQSDLDDVGAMVGQAGEVIAQLRSSYGAETFDAEIEVDTDQTTGHIDLRSLIDDGKTELVIDWKTGRKHGDYKNQVAGYVVGRLEQNPGADRGIGLVVWLRTGEVERVDLLRSDIPQWRAMFAAQYAAIGTHYAAGEHCGFCPRRLECPTYDAHRRAGVSALVEAQKTAVAITPAIVAEYWDRAEAAKKALEWWDSGVRDLLNRGPIDLLSGKQVYLGEQSQTNVSVRNSWQALGELGYTPNDINDCLRVSVGDLKKKAHLIIGGSQKEAESMLMGKLQSVGAVTVTKFTKKMYRKGGTK